jgi:hypothetical protein
MLTVCGFFTVRYDAVLLQLRGVVEEPSRDALLDAVQVFRVRLQLDLHAFE